MIVHIPFMNRFSHPMLSGSKTWTSRTKKYGEIGDTFNYFNATFEIVDVVRLNLLKVADHYYEEGLQSREEFIEVWRHLHPRKGFDAMQWVYVHKFKRVYKPPEKPVRGRPDDPIIEDLSLR